MSDLMAVAKRAQLLVIWLAALLPQHSYAADEESPMPKNAKKQTSSSLVDLRTEIRKSTTLKSTTDGVTFEEREVYYETLGRLSETPQKLLNEQSQSNLNARWQESRFKNNPYAEFPVYVDLFQNPENYHGELVTFRGHVQRVVKTPAGENDFGISELYEIWMFTEDSQSNPAVIVTPTIPDALPVGDEITDHIKVTGIFFKFYTYNAQDTKRFAPLILAGNIQLRDPTKSSEEGRSENLQLYLLFIGQFVLLLVIAITVGFFWGKFGTRRRMREFHLESIGDEPPITVHDAPELSQEDRKGQALDENNS